MRSALMGLLSNNHLGAITCIHQGQGEAKSSAGFVQVWPYPGQARWDMAFISPSLDRHLNASDIWYRLLTYLIIYAAEQGVLRVTARSSEDAEAEDVFRHAGFRLVGREEVFALSSVQQKTATPRGLRTVRESDRWALRELCRQVIPLSMQDPQTGLPYQTTLSAHSVPGSAGLEEFVWVQRDEIMAYFGLLRASGGCWLDIVVRPHHRGDILHHLKHLLGQAQNGASQPVYCTVPDYCVGVSWLLRTLGFEPYARQALLAAATAAEVRVRPKILIPGLEGTVDVGTPMTSSYCGEVSPDSQTWRAG
jgi:hypothetical protein